MPKIYICQTVLRGLDRPHNACASSHGHSGPQSVGPESRVVDKDQASEEYHIYMVYHELRLSDGGGMTSGTPGANCTDKVSAKG